MKKELDYKLGATLCLQNALNHMKVADASKDISFGIAHAHVILASEEAMKAAMLFNISFDKSIMSEYKDFDQYFSDHKHKHNTIFGILQLGVFVETFLSKKMEPLLKSDIKNLESNELKAKIQEGKNNAVNWFSDLADASKTDVTLDSNEDWWKQAETNKKEGFYIDILKKRAEYTGPHKCSEKKFFKGRKIAEDWIEKVKWMINELESDENSEIYWEMRKAQLQGLKNNEL